MTSPSIAVIGEALIDLVETGDDEPRLARPGGSPYNVALGLARLGHPTAFVGRISRDPLGTILRAHAQRSGVELTLTVDAPEPSTVALVTLDGTGTAQYRFGVDGTADFRFTEAELARIPDDIAAVHFGSLASWLGPGDAAIAARVAGLGAAGAAVSYDPNVRPHLQPDRAAARAQVEAALPLAHLVKVSEEDLEWIHPGVPTEDVAREWLTRGPSVVVITCGGNGAQACTAHGRARSAKIAIEVLDTVGAGDAFMSGLLDALMRRGLLTPTGLASLDVGDGDGAATLAGLLNDAALIAAITCTRAGANPPRAADVDEWSAVRPPGARHAGAGG